jgi:hypothetical protein
MTNSLFSKCIDVVVVQNQSVLEGIRIEFDIEHENVLVGLKNYTQNECIFSELALGLTAVREKHEKSKSITSLVSRLSLNDLNSNLNFKVKRVEKSYQTTLRPSVLFRLYSLRKITNRTRLLFFVFFWV